MPGPPTGTNVRLLLSGCGCAPELLRRHGALLPLLEQAVRASEMTPLRGVGHDFPDAGHTTCVILAESHLVVHSYPECDAAVVVELSVCDHQRDNRERALTLARRVSALFDPRQRRMELLPMTPGGAAPASDV